MTGNPACRTCLHFRQTQPLHEPRCTVPGREPRKVAPSGLCGKWEAAR